MWGPFKLFDRSDRVSREIRNSRLLSCELCSSLKAGVCTECGCVVKLKTKVASEECPLGKWPKQEL